ncbi:MAG TPA: ClbS/DfsB family four-helix bundle protein [Acidobacteriota bacterium]|nr:ClbS/DfsB family four-helix bundle protein [Acidobacteriota bacterium]
MPIPTTRDELIEMTRSAFQKLQAELEAAGPRAGDVPCVETWSVKDLLAVRAWWTERVIDWVEAGRRGQVPVLPAQGYRWTETPRLNDDLVKKARPESYRSVRSRLEKGYERVMRTIDSLDDRELLQAGVFEWAGKYPVSRWISINTARQYTTARTLIRRALKQR